MGITTEGHGRARTHQAAGNIWGGGAKGTFGLSGQLHLLLKTTYDYLETLSKGANLREVWESKSGFLASGVRSFRARSLGPPSTTPRGRGEAQHWSLDKSQQVSYLQLVSIGWETCWVELLPRLGSGAALGWPF